MKSSSGQSNSVPTSSRLFSWNNIFYSLFLDPRALLPLAFSSWRKALKTALIAVTLCALILGTVKSIGFFKAGSDWAAWFSARLESITISDDKLQWQGLSELPATFWKDGYRVDFNPENSKFKDFKERFQEGRRGIWLSTTAVYFWQRNVQGEIVSLPIWREGKIIDKVHYTLLMPESLSVESENFLSKTRGIMGKYIIPSLFVSSILRTFFVFFFYTFIFAAIPFILQSPMRNHGFAAIHAFYMYLGIPPILIATLYTILRLPWMEFNLMFVIAFLGYMLFATWHTSKEWQSLTKEKDNTP